MQGIEGSTVIITGAGQGIGRAYALAFAERGAKVVVADLVGSAAQAVSRQLVSKGGDALAVEVDVSDVQQVDEMIKSVADRFGPADILVNNAAVFSTLRMRPFEEIDADEWDRVFRVNARGTFLCCKAVAPSMKERRAGKIVNIASSVVTTGRANYAHYVASKGAVVALTRALATELGPYNVNVNAISPHGIVTEVVRETITEDQWEGILAAQALKRKGTVDDLVGVTIFLASAASDYMTGQTLQVDAGLRYL